MDCYCYMVECSDGTYYTGWTTNPTRRVRAHNAGRGGRYTRSRRPVRLVFIEEQDDRARAMRRERAIKAMTRREKQELIGGLSGERRAPDQWERRKERPVHRMERHTSLVISEKSTRASP